MRRPAIFLLGLIAATATVPQASNAQFALSPRGILGAVTAPLRGMMHGLPHRSRHHRPGREAEAQPRPPTPTEKEQAKLGRSGPPTWPTAYEDVLGYTFWPDLYTARYRQHGFGDIVTSLIGPLNRAGPMVSAAAPRRETTGAAGVEPAAAPACADIKAADENWPADRIEQTVQLGPEQHSKLYEMQVAIADAAKSVAPGCSDDATFAPVQRLSATVQRLWAVQNSGVRIRATLQAFYNSLTDEQKAKFAAPPSDSPPDANTATTEPMGRQYQACAAQAADADRFGKQIQLTAATTEGQRTSLEALNRTAADMAKLSMGACAQPVPTTPLERLDAANSGLDTLIFAATTLQMAVNDLYGQLNGEQKAKFDSLGR